MYSTVHMLNNIAVVRKGTPSHKWLVLKGLMKQPTVIAHSFISLMTHCSKMTSAHNSSIKCCQNYEPILNRMHDELMK